MAATIVAGRYELAELVGTGGASRVHAARDLVTGARVAVKLLDGGTSKASLRVHREISALRLLRLPGVVALLDEGTHADSHFLVMDLVPGRAFPGAAVPVTWDTLAPTVLALLEILGRVHAAGVVHRDLKPSNVLVDDAGRVTVLDFGISWGPALGEAVTTEGTIVGTPEYLAPEQFLGAVGDARTDLYAVGIMIYEALTGRQPHEASDFAELVALKRSQAPAPMRVAAPGVDRDVASVVDQLLSMDPFDRPQSAGEALQAFFGQRPPGGSGRAMPRLGGDAALEQLLAAARAGRSADVAGASGTGRTRLVVDAADRLVAEGRAVLWLQPGSAPYSSLAPVLGGLDALKQSSHAEVVTEVESRVEKRLRGGAVLIADDAKRLDRWSAAAIERCRGAGCVVRVVTGSAAATGGDVIRLEALNETDLRPLFAGPDRIFHLREDGARELWRRTGGLPARIATEIAAWVRAGLAHWDGDRVVVRREALHRLRGGQSVGDELLLRPGTGSAGSPHLDELLAWIAFAWPHASVDLLAKVTGEPRWSIEPALAALVEEGMVRRLPDGAVQPLLVPRALHSWSAERRRDAHRALSEALPPGTPMRLRHLAAAGEPRELIEEALLLAPELTRQGRTGDALVVLEEGLSAARRAGDRERETLVLVEFAKTCLAEGTPHAVDRALYEMSRAERKAAPIPQVERLLHGARAAATGDPERALAMLAETGAFDDVELEQWRHGQRVRASRRLSVDRQAEVLVEVESWAKRTGHRRASAGLASWRALLMQEQGRWAEAASLHLAAAQQTDRIAAQMACRYNAGSALLNDGRLEESREAAGKCRELAISCHSMRYEASAEQLLRTIGYRLGEQSAPDLELVEAVEALGDPWLQKDTLGTEAAMAWRFGAFPQARQLAARWGQVCEKLGQTGVKLVARALEILCGAVPESGEIERLFEKAREFPDTEDAVQTLGLLAEAAPERASEFRAAARRRAASLPPGDPLRRSLVLSVKETLEGVGPQENG